MTYPCVVSGSFDPFTNGHLNLVTEALDLFSRVDIVVAQNAAKSGGLFTLDERVEMINEVFAGDPRVRTHVMQPGQFLITYAQALGAHAIVRGLRNTTDFEYEHSVDLVQRKLSAIKTVYLITPRELTEVSSSLIKTLCPLNGWEKIVKDYVPPAVMNRLVKKMC